MQLGTGGAQKYKAHARESVHRCNVCNKAFKSLPTPNQHTCWQHIGHVFVCKGCGKKFKTNTSSTDTKTFVKLLLFHE